VFAVDSFTDFYSKKIKASNSSQLRKNDQCIFIESDLLHADLGQLFADVDIVFHLAAQPGVRSSWGVGFDDYARNNLMVLQRLFEAGREHPSVNMVAASSSSVYGDSESFPTLENVELRPLSPYGMTKAAGELLAHVYRRNYGLSISMLRYFTVYGPRQRPDMAFHRLIQAALCEKEFTVLGDGTQTRDFTYVADAVAGTILAGLRSEAGRAYNIGGGSRHTLNSVISEIEIISGKPLRLIYADVQRGDVRDTSADVSRAKNELGFEPTRSLVQGLTEQYKWHRHHGELLS